MSGTTKGAKKIAKAKLKEDPEYYKKLANKPQKPRGGANSSGSFKKGDNPHASKGGTTSKRKAKEKTNFNIDTTSIEDIDPNFEFIETPRAKKTGEIK